MLLDGRTLAECGVEDLSIVELSLALDGGRKKNKKVKLAVLKYYKVDPRTHKIERLKRECTHPDCGPGIFMANHYDRQYW
jgi:ubiquitin-small subunit ribosomal protein S27Ae